MNRRNALKTTFLGAGASLTIPLLSFKSKQKVSRVQSKVTQPPLSYAYNALEPHIDAETMKIHYSKHHAGYTRKFNAALAENNITFTSLPELFKTISQYPSSVINNGGGFFNHRLFWNCITPRGLKEPQGQLAIDINKTFGSIEAFKTEFSHAAKTQFGSGWAWLILDEDNNLKITKTPNQINPIMDLADENGRPILCLDVWEHAYYLNYQNNRGEYIDAFWNIVDWDKLRKRYEYALKKKFEIKVTKLD